MFVPAVREGQNAEGKHPPFAHTIANFATSQLNISEEIPRLHLELKWVGLWPAKHFLFPCECVVQEISRFALRQAKWMRRATAANVNVM
jgi:hypothetical protein